MRGERINLNYRIVNKENLKYIKIQSGARAIRSEQDALELVALCGENETSFLVLHHEALSDDFFKLKTGIAGAMLQKLVNYRVKTAIIIEDTSEFGIRFNEFAAEANRGSQYRVFNDVGKAEDWFREGT